MILLGRLTAALVAILIVGIYPVTASDKTTLTLNKELSVSPNRCVALRQGQTCFKDLTVKWRAPNNANYCVRFKGEETMLRCWQNRKEASFIFDFQSNRTRTIELVNQDSNRVFGKAEITIAWVYKSKSRAKASWRLF